jgi:hypothetical protein
MQAVEIIGEKDFEGFLRDSDGWGWLDPGVTSGDTIWTIDALDAQ